MLRHPKPVVAQPLGSLHRGNGFGYGFGGCSAQANDGLVEYAEFHLFSFLSVLLFLKECVITRGNGKLFDLNILIVLKAPNAYIVETIFFL
jgi:hypothetical protein